VPAVSACDLVLCLWCRQACISRRRHYQDSQETKGRGGKSVTVIDGVPETTDKLKALCKQLKQRCGVGGAVKAAQIEIQGDQRTLCQQYLESLGYDVKLSGG